VTDEFVSLNASSRPVVTIEVGDRRFLIRRVVTGVRQLWSAFVVEFMGYMERVNEYDSAVKKLRAGGKPGAAEEIRKLTEEVEAAVDGFSIRKIDALLRIIELLLTKNGHEFDRQWWIENAEESEYKDFIISALEKDSPPVKKKEPAEASTGEG
jgi:hypothetical protein